MSIYKLLHPFCLIIGFALLFTAATINAETCDIQLLTLVGTVMLLVGAAVKRAQK
jgi:hypothetical protein